MFAVPIHLACLIYAVLKVHSSDGDHSHFGRRSALCITAAAFQIVQSRAREKRTGNIVARCVSGIFIGGKAKKESSRSAVTVVAATGFGALIGSGLGRSNPS